LSRQESGGALRNHSDYSDISFVSGNHYTINHNPLIRGYAERTKTMDDKELLRVSLSLTQYDMSAIDELIDAYPRLYDVWRFLRELMDVTKDIDMQLTIAQEKIKYLREELGMFNDEE
jgi:GTP1/Obg family GTP-binding protein